LSAGLRNEVIVMIFLQHPFFKIDSQHTYRGDLQTLVPKVDNVYMQGFIDFKDSTAIIYGRQGTILYPGTNPSAPNINWQDIEYSKTVWELLFAISGGNLPGFPKQYNKLNK
jgi:hypothetical protein